MYSQNDGHTILYYTTLLYISYGHTMKSGKYLILSVRECFRWKLFSTHPIAATGVIDHPPRIRIRGQGYIKCNLTMTTFIPQISFFIPQHKNSIILEVVKIQMPVQIKQKGEEKTLPQIRWLLTRSVPSYRMLLSSQFGVLMSTLKLWKGQPSMSTFRPINAPPQFGVGPKNYPIWRISTPGHLLNLTQLF